MTVLSYKRTTLNHNSQKAGAPLATRRLEEEYPRVKSSWPDDAQDRAARWRG